MTKYRSRDIVVQSVSHAWLFATLWTAAHQAYMFLHYLPEFAWVSIESMMPSNHLILCRPLLFLSSTFPGTRVFYNELVLSIRWPIYWGFSLTISHFNANSGLISYRADRFDLHAVQGTLKSFLQHHSSKPTILWCSAFFHVQLSHPNLTTGKPIALTICTFVGKVTFVDYESYSISSKGFLTTVVDTMVIWIKFTYSLTLSFTDS